MSSSQGASISWDTFYNIVGSKLRSSSKSHNGINPATGEKLWDVPVADKKDVNDAVKFAQACFKQWKKTSLDERREKVKKFAEVLKANEENLIKIFCAETGKPVQFAHHEFGLAYDFTTWPATCEFPSDVYEDDEKIIQHKYVPMGVVGAICPWNFPVLLSLAKISPAIIAGNAVIVKPSPYTPYTTLKFIELAQSVFPPGLLQCVGGSDELGPMLTSHPDIAKISFTGSIATGKKVMAACASTLKRVTLELGGNDPCIVLPDVDIAAIAPQVALNAFFNTGQVCIASKRLFIHESIYKEFLGAMVKFVGGALKPGSSYEEGVMLGPVQNKMQYEKVQQFFADTKKNGYKIAVGGDDAPDVSAANRNGFFLRPTIIDNPPDDSMIVREEPFGPIVPAQPWSDIDELIERVNSTNAGLGAVIFSKDVKQAEGLAEQIESGTVWINSGSKIQPNAFFSGVKESGIGGEWGRQGLIGYCNPLVIHTSKL